MIQLQDMLSFKKLRLFHQGLMVFMLPVVSILGMSWYVNHLLARSGTDAQQQLEYVQVTVAASDYCNALSRAEMPSMMLLGPITEQAIHNVIESDRLVARKLISLKKLLASPEDAQCLKQVEGDARHLLDLQSYYAAASKNPALRDEVVVHPLMQYPDVQNFSASPMMQRYARMNDLDETTPLSIGIRVGLLSLIVVTLMLTFVLTALFVWNILLRLMHVRQNSTALACVEMLEPPLKGSDELARLDQALYVNAWEVRDLERYRAELFELVSGYLAKHVQRIAEHIEELKRHSKEINEQGLSLINKSNDSIDRLSRLIKELSGTAANQELSQFARTNVLAAIEHATQGVSQLADKKRIKIECSASASLVLVADRDKLIQVLVNLLSNAIKFSPEDSTISVLAQASRQNVVIKVTDQGRGIPEEFRKRMFTRFAQAEAGDAARSKGTGLGLNICKSIAEEHGGAISVESELGVGSTFIVTLPSGGPDKRPQKSASKGGEAESVARPRVMRNPLDWLNKCAPLSLKGLVLIMVPLLFQFTLIGFTVPMISRIDRDIRALKNARQVAYIATELDRDLCLFVYVDSFLNAVLRQEDVSAYGKYIDSCEQLISRLDQANYDREKRVQFSASVENFLAAARKSMLSGQRLTEAQKANNRYLSSRSKDLDQAVQKLARWAEEMQAKDGLTTEARQHLELVSTFAAALFCMLSMALFWLIFTSITQRIRGIIDNSNRLKNNQPLVPPGAGTDEIAELERRFYASACWLVELRNFKEELISILSHELGTPLTAVQGMFYLLSAGAFGPLTDKAMAPTTAATVECGKILALVNDLLDTEKIKARRMELVRAEFDLGEAVAEVVNNLQPAADEKDVRITCEGMEPLTLSVDGERIKNAIKAMINFAIDRTPAGEEILIRTERDEVVCLSVQDGGPLLNDNEKKASFETFSCTRDVDIELRLALSLARLVLELHGGTLVITDLHGRNTTQLSLYAPVRALTLDG